MHDVSRWMGPLLSLLVLLACGDDGDRPTVSRAAHQSRYSTPPSRPEFGPWSEPVNLGPMVNSDVADLSPALSHDALGVYFASDRVTEATVGGRDIWVSRRACVGCPWGTPVNVTAVNSTAADGDPEVSSDGHRLFFTSNRAGGYGGDDLYVSHRANPHDDLGWDPPVNLGPDVNTSLGEVGPFYLQSVEDASANLYFARGDGSTTVSGFDLYQTRVWMRGEATGTPAPIDSLNSAHGEAKAVVRRDGREVFFWSNRPGGPSPGTPGQQFDLWTAIRQSVHDPWYPAVHVGAPLNTVWNELTLDLADDGRTIVFASNRPGGLGRNDLWMSERVKIGSDTIDRDE